MQDALGRLQELGDRALSSRARRAVGLACLVSAAAVYHWVQSLERATPWIFPDEARFAEASRAVLESGAPEVRGQFEVLGSLHAYLTAPAWAVPDVADALSGVALINSLAFASAAIPVYLLARTLVGPWSGMAAAAAAVAIPAAFYASTLMAEPLAFPLVMWAAYGSARWLRDRSLVAAAVVGATVVVGPLVRDQLLVLPVAAGLAVACDAGAHRDAGAWRRLLAVGVTIAAACLIVTVLVGRVNMEANVDAVMADLPGVAEAALRSLGATVAAVWVIPAAALGATWSWLRPGEDAARRSFAATGLAFVVVFALYTGAKAEIVGGIAELPEERNLFYLEGLAMVALVAALARVGLAAAGTSAGAAIILLFVLDLGDQPISPILSEDPGLSWIWHAGTADGGLAPWVVPLYIALAVLSVPLLVWSPDVVAPAAALAVGLALLWSGSLAYRGDHIFSSEIASQWLGEDPSWVDDLDSGDVGLVVTGDTPDLNGIWTTIVWNRDLSEIAEIDTSLGLAPGQATFASDGRLSFVDVDAIVAPVSWRPDGEVIADRARPALAATRVGDDPRIAARLIGRFPDGWGGEEVRLVRYLDGPPGVVRVPVSAENPAVAERRFVDLVSIDLATQDSTLEPVDGRPWSATREIFEPGSARELSVAVPDGPFTVAVRTRPLSSVPGDPRALGLIFGGFTAPGIDGAL